MRTWRKTGHSHKWLDNLQQNVWNLKWLQKVCIGEMNICSPCHLITCSIIWTAQVLSCYLPNEFIDMNSKGPFLLSTKWIYRYEQQRPFLTIYPMNLQMFGLTLPLLSNRNCLFLTPEFRKTLHQQSMQLSTWAGQWRLTLGGMPRRSPLGRVRSLLSSSTEFKFSTHSGSTSPSKMIHCRLVSSPRTLSIILHSRDHQRVRKWYMQLKCWLDFSCIYPWLFTPVFATVAVI